MIKAVFELKLIFGNASALRLSFAYTKKDMLHIKNSQVIDIPIHPIHHC